jgi:hypothetical protein
VQYLLKYATPRQAECIKAYIEHGSSRKAAAALGIAKSGVNDAINAVKVKAALQGESPEHDMTRSVPDGFKVKGVSTYYNKDGVASGQWVKSSADEQRRYELMLEAVEALKEELPVYEPVEFAGSGNSDLLCMYVITDYHFAQLSDGFETRGDDYDLKIAERQLIAWFSQAIEQSPDADVGVFAQCGDFMHFSGSALEAVTEMSKNILDADSRLYKVVRVVIRVIRSVIKMLLDKHKTVHVIFAEGNHDMSASVYMREWLSVMYEDEPRITIDTSADPYYAYEFGNTSIFVHHGHKRKVSDISKVFASKFREMFGRTKYSYAHMGHLHHVDVKEDHLMIVEQHRTLAASDAHSSRGGYSSGRDAKVIVYHRKYGEVARTTINSSMVADCHG